MKGPMVLLCYAEGSGSAWEAICLDFDIAVQGTSDRDVMNKLEAAIHDYFEYVRGLPQEEQERFLRRRVPMKVMLGFFIKTGLSWL